MTSVLVIDDEMQIRRLLRVALEKQGYAVHEAATGEEGLQMVLGKKPDIVLLDLGLPGQGRGRGAGQAALVVLGPGHHPFGPQRGGGHRASPRRGGG